MIRRWRSPAVREAAAGTTSSGACRHRTGEKAAYTAKRLEAPCAILPRGRTGYRGECVTFENGSCFPRVTPIPILMSGGIRANPRTGSPERFEPPLRTQTRSCDGWIPEGSPALIAKGIAVVARLVRALHCFAADEASYKRRVR